MEFWKTYPRKDAKVDAYKAWRQKQPSRETQDKIRVALAAQCRRWALDDYRFVPLPGSYLRGERWEDEGVKTAPAKRLPTVDELRARYEL